jgi:hypothetical protein
LSSAGWRNSITQRSSPSARLPSDTEPDLSLAIKAEYLQKVVDVLLQDRDYWREVALTVQTALPPDRMWIKKLFPASADDRRLN